jgi:hypothetical protein
MPDGRAAASKAVRSGFDSRLGHSASSQTGGPWRRPGTPTTPAGVKTSTGPGWNAPMTRVLDFTALSVARPVASTNGHDEALGDHRIRIERSRKRVMAMAATDSANNVQHPGGLDDEYPIELSTVDAQLPLCHEGRPRRAHTTTPGKEVTRACTTSAPKPPATRTNRSPSSRPRRPYRPRGGAAGALHRNDQLPAPAGGWSNLMVTGTVIGLSTRPVNGTAARPPSR